MVADEAVQYILNKYHLDLDGPNPIEIDDTRLSLIELFKELNFTVGVEVGVDEGVYSELLCQSNPNLTLCSIDPWMAYLRGPAMYSQEKLGRHYESAAERLSKYPNCFIMKEHSMDAVTEFDDGCLDFVYIDGDHSFDFVMEDIIEWSKKVRSGGIVSGHDYKDSTERYPFHIKLATHAYTTAHNISPWFVLTKLVPLSDVPSWMWVKP